MNEIIFLGLTKSQWEFVNSFSDWLSAIGTLAAVVVALYLASKASKPRAKVSVGHKIIINSKNDHQEYIEFRIVNTGDRNIMVTQIGWKAGLWKTRYCVQMYDPALSSKLPVELSHGQEAQWFVPLHAREGGLVKHFARTMLMPNYRSSCFGLRALFHTSLGNTFRARPEQNLLSKLKAACKDLEKSQPEIERKKESTK